jgi:hypothetical protein
MIERNIEQLENTGPHGSKRQLVPRERCLAEQPSMPDVVNR